MIEPFIERIEGRYSKETIRHPKRMKSLFVDELITPKLLRKLQMQVLKKCISVQHLHVILVMVYVKNVTVKPCYR